MTSAPDQGSATASSGHFLHNLILFGRLLRGLGLDVNPGRVIDLVHALGAIDVRRRSDFYHAARCLMVHRREDIALFDEAFERFWRAPDEWRNVDWEALLPRRAPRGPLVAHPPLREPSEPPAEPGSESSREERPPVLELTLTYSSREVLRRKDFSELSGDELEAIKRLMAELVWRLGERRTRRQRVGAGRLPHLRRTFRRNLRYGGELLLWVRRERKSKPRPLVLLADISGSMERYTRLLLHFLYSLAEGLKQKVEVFVFGTRLTCVSRHLRGRHVERALSEVSRAVPDWSGGTRIGEALRTFNVQWSRRVLGRGAVLLVISDGWDRGDVELLANEMARLQRSSYRLIWLNPLLGSPQYEPLTRGMQAALPYVDDFLPVHNLASLEDLASHLERLPHRRGRRVSLGRH